MPRSWPCSRHAFFGPSRILVLGPDSSLAAVILAVVLPVSGGDAIRAVAVASAAAVQQAVAQAPSLPNIRWRCASSFPKSLDTIYGGAELIAKRVKELTSGKFEIRVFAAGEIVPAFGVVDAIQQNTVECAHTASYYFVGKNKTFAFDTTIPFGMNQRQQNA